MSDQKIRWGILGCGNIAGKFSQALNSLDDAEIVAAASRSLEKVKEFASTYGIASTYGSYQEMVADPEVDVVYVSTPHNFHKEHSLLCLNGGKPVLCEKPFALNSREAMEVIQLARSKDLFLMEAMWTRYLPAIRKLKGWLNEGLIGEIRLVKADFGIRRPLGPEHRLFNPNLAGGALLDLGIYPISFAYHVMEQEPIEVTSLATIGPTGVDEESAYLFKYKSGAMAILSSGSMVETDCKGEIFGTKGFITVPDFWKAEKISISIGDSEEHHELAHHSNGMEYEAQEVMDCLRQGKTESELMPLDETIQIISCLDKMRAQWGLKYPGEQVNNEQ